MRPAREFIATEKPRVWHHTFDQYAAASSCAAVEELTAAGIKLGPFEADEPCHTGLLFLNKITQPLCEFVREVSRNGLVRVLAITTAPEPPPSGDTWRLLRCGASDVLCWSACAEPAQQVAARLERWTAVDRLVDSPLVRNNLVGRNRAWISVLRQVVELASFTDSTVLIVGESGTGKELVARLIHSLDRRLPRFAVACFSAWLIRIWRMARAATPKKCARSAQAKEVWSTSFRYASWSSAVVFRVCLALCPRSCRCAMRRSSS